MSWCDGRRALTAVLLGLPLAACGFHPLYAERTPLAYDPALAAIEVRPAPDRIGQILVDQLREQFNPRGANVKPRYVLSIALTVARADLGIRRDNTSTRGELTLYATLKLDEAGSDTTVLQESIRRLAAFNLPDDAFAATVAEQNAREEAANDLGREIAERIAVYLRQARPAGNGA